MNGKVGVRELDGGDGVQRRKVGVEMYGDTERGELVFEGKK